MHRTRRVNLAFLSTLLLTLPLLGRASEPAPPSVGNLNRPAAQVEAAVDIVFVLDTTGSMSGLLEGAKQKVWSIVNDVAKGTPTPAIRVGLVGYRDKGDQYITQVFPLTDDLDSMFSSLTSFQADGGGDGPEDVNRALKDAVHKLNWSTDHQTLRILFLVGDAPPHMDYRGEAQYPNLVKDAVMKEIIVNTIRCGNWDETGRVWADIARRGEGEFFTIDQSGGTVKITTPYDAKLAEYSAKLSGTYVAYGGASERKRLVSKFKASEEVAAAAAPEASASRAEFRAKKAVATGRLAEKDIVAEMADGESKIGELEKENLPPELQKLSDEELQAHVRKKAKERQEILEKIEVLSKKREEYIRQEQAKTGDGKADSFDAAVRKSIRKKAAEKGIRYD